MLAHDSDQLFEMDTENCSALEPRTLAPKPSPVTYNDKTTGTTQTFKCYDERDLTFLNENMNEKGLYYKNDFWANTLGQYPLAELENEYDYETDQE